METNTEKAKQINPWRSCFFDTLLWRERPLNDKYPKRINIADVHTAFPHQRIISSG